MHETEVSDAMIDIEKNLIAQRRLSKHSKSAEDKTKAIKPRNLSLRGILRFSRRLMRFFAYAAAIMFSLVSISAVNDADTEILLPKLLLCYRS